MQQPPTLDRRRLLTTVAASAAGLRPPRRASPRPNHTNIPARPPSETVRFKADDLTLAGALYLPRDHVPGRRYPAAVVGGSLTSVQEQMGGIYAAELADRGVIALAVDYRNFGQSGGEPRQFEDPAGKSRDLSAAAAFLAERADVAGVGLLGVCTSGGTVLYAAAEDRRIRAVATVAGWFAEPAVTPGLYGGPEAVAERRERGRVATRRYRETGVVDVIPAYHDTDQTASHVGPMEYYMDRARGGGVPEWRNEFAVMSWEPWLDFDPVARASRVTAPTLIVHSDDSALPDQARKVHGLLGGPKALHWATGQHFDFYDQPQPVQAAADAVAAHFRATLK